MHQAIQLTRERTQWNRATRQHETTREVAYAITSLTRMQANARELLEKTRGHWGIENRLHWVRDETFGEDRCRVRSGNAPQLLAAVRNAATSALRLEGFDNLAAALRNFGRNSRRSLTWLGILKE